MKSVMEGKCDRVLLLMFSGMNSEATHLQALRYLNRLLGLYGPAAVGAPVTRGAGPAAPPPRPHS